MDGTFQVKHDPLLRQFLSNPEISERPAGSSTGFAAMRLLVAAVDGSQVIAVGVLLSTFLYPGHVLRAIGLGLVAAALALLIRRGTRSTTSFQKITVGSVARRAGLAVALACTALLAIVLLLGGGGEEAALASWIVSWGVVSAALSAGMRGLPIPLFRRITKRAIRPNVVVVGPPAGADMMTDVLASQGSHCVVAQLDPARLADMQRLDALAAGGSVDKVVIVGCDEAGVERICFGLSDTPTLVCLGFATPMVSSLMSGALHLTQQAPFLPLLPSPMSDWRGILKRWIDVALVLILIPVIAPVLIAAALAIRIESPGPILFRQWRFGLGSQPTRILKFRTMFHDRGDHTGEARTMARDPRVTPVGRILRRTSIDELPQLLNVLRGDMSLVGPRPHATHMKVDGNYYFEAVQGYRIRHRVKPGITGWAQVTGSRGEVDTMDKALERVEKDLWYVRNWSLMLDFRILVMTALGRFASPTAD